MAFPVQKLLSSRVSCADVVQCAYDLGEQEVRVYEALNNLGPSRTEEIATAVGRDPSVVHRNLQKLVSCGIVVKDKKTIAGGGYFHAYEALPKAEVKRRLRACVDDWHDQMLRAIKRL